MKSIQVTQTYRIGPVKISKMSRGYAGIYLPKMFSFLRGKNALITIEVLEEIER